MKKSKIVNGESCCKIKFLQIKNKQILFYKYDRKCYVNLCKDE